MVFYTPRSYDTLTWKRNAQWSVYPEDHIGRPKGVAKALPDASLVGRAGSWMEVACREKPSWPWALDANALGTRDFRTTRLNILHASLKNASGSGITVWSGGRIGFLVAGHSGPAGVTSWLRGLSEIAGVEIRTMQAGTEIKDTVRLFLVGA